MSGESFLHFLVVLNFLLDVRLVVILHFLVVALDVLKRVYHRKMISVLLPLVFLHKFPVRFQIHLLLTRVVAVAGHDDSLNDLTNCLEV